MNKIIINFIFFSLYAVNEKRNDDVDTKIDDTISTERCSSNESGKKISNFIKNKKLFIICMYAYYKNHILDIYIVEKENRGKIA